MRLGVLENLIPRGHTGSSRFQKKKITEKASSNELERFEQKGSNEYQKEKAGVIKKKVKRNKSRILWRPYVLNVYDK